MRTFAWTWLVCAACASSPRPAPTAAAGASTTTAPQGSAQVALGDSTKVTGGDPCEGGEVYSVGPAQGATRGPGVKADSALVSGSLDKNLISYVLAKNMAKIRYCYEQALATTPKLEGRVVAHFTIGPDGHVTDASASGLANVDDCIARMIKTFEFPAPTGGSVSVTYPFVFKAAD